MQLLSWLRFMKVGKVEKNFLHTSSVFVAYSPSDWSMKMKLCRFLALGHEQKLAKIFDSYLHNH